MHSSFTTALLGLAASASAHVLPRTTTQTTHHHPRAASARRCGEREPTEVQVSQSLDLHRVETARVAEDSSAYDYTLEVNVFVHIVSTTSASAITLEQIKGQIDYLNLAFNPYDVSFRHNYTDYTVNGNWSIGGADDIMKQHLRRGSYADLNLYYLDRPLLDGDDVLGYCTFPEPGVTEGSETYMLDGCIVDAQTVPGGTLEPFNMGGTTVHEVGHWFNLFHTFQGGCDAEGDEVWDTPAQDSPSSGCPVMRDSCPGQPGIDPIHNFMDYSDDICYEGFSLGQRRRMHSSFENYRI